MTGLETGFLLLTCRLGNPDRKVLTMAQMRTLAQRVRDIAIDDADRDLTAADLTALGYGQEMAERIVALLNEQALLNVYLRRAAKTGCVPISRISEPYPLELRKRLGLDSPGCLWAKGDLSLLETPMIALVGSRELLDANRVFAEEVGRQAARQGFTLVSGNARGADRAAQNACLASGGKVISVVADSLVEKKVRDNLLYLSEEAFDAEFSAQRALSRNRCVHALGALTFVAQCGLHAGGTWDGTVKNLRHGWSDVYCFDDGSEVMAELEQMGAEGIDADSLKDFCSLYTNVRSFLDE